MATKNLWYDKINKNVYFFGWKESPSLKSKEQKTVFKKFKDNIVATTDKRLAKLIRTFEVSFPEIVNQLSEEWKLELGLGSENFKRLSKEKQDFHIGRNRWDYTSDTGIQAEVDHIRSTGKDRYGRFANAEDTFDTLQNEKYELRWRKKNEPESTIPELDDRAKEFKEEEKFVTRQQELIDKQIEADEVTYDKKRIKELNEKFGPYRLRTQRQALNLDPKKLWINKTKKHQYRLPTWIGGSFAPYRFVRKMIEEGKITIVPEIMKEPGYQQISVDTSFGKADRGGLTARWADIKKIEGGNPTQVFDEQGNLTGKISLNEHHLERFSRTLFPDTPEEFFVIDPVIHENYGKIWPLDEGGTLPTSRVSKGKAWRKDVLGRPSEDPMAAAPWTRYGQLKPDVGMHGTGVDSERGFRNRHENIIKSQAQFLVNIFTDILTDPNIYDNISEGHPFSIGLTEQAWSEMIDEITRVIPNMSESTQEPMKNPRKMTKDNILDGGSNQELGYGDTHEAITEYEWHHEHDKLKSEKQKAEFRKKYKLDKAIPYQWKDAIRLAKRSLYDLDIIKFRPDQIKLMQEGIRDPFQFDLEEDYYPPKMSEDRWAYEQNQQDPEERNRNPLIGGERQWVDHDFTIPRGNRAIEIMNERRKGNETGFISQFEQSLQGFGDKLQDHQLSTLYRDNFKLFPNIYYDKNLTEPDYYVLQELGISDLSAEDIENRLYKNIPALAKKYAPETPPDKIMQVVRDYEQKEQQDIKRREDLQFSRQFKEKSAGTEPEPELKAWLDQKRISYLPEDIYKKQDELDEKYGSPTEGFVPSQEFTSTGRVWQGDYLAEVEANKIRQENIKSRLQSEDPELSDDDADLLAEQISSAKNVEEVVKNLKELGFTPEQALGLDPEESEQEEEELDRIALEQEQEKLDAIEAERQKNLKALEQEQTDTNLLDDIQKSSQEAEQESSQEALEALGALERVSKFLDRTPPRKLPPVKPKSTASFIQQPTADKTQSKIRNFVIDQEEKIKKLEKQTGKTFSNSQRASYVEREFNRQFTNTETKKQGLSTLRKFMEKNQKRFPHLQEFIQRQEGTAKSSQLEQESRKTFEEWEKNTKKPAKKPTKIPTFGPFFILEQLQQLVPGMGPVDPEGRPVAKLDKQMKTLIG